jgi:hypothetical protein
MLLQRRYTMEMHQQARGSDVAEMEGEFAPPQGLEEMIREARELTVKLQHLEDSIEGVFVAVPARNHWRACG